MLTSSTLDFEQANDSTELEEYEEYCRRELPRVVRAAIEGIVSHETYPLEERIISQLESILRNAQHQVYSSYQSTSISNVVNMPSVETSSRLAAGEPGSMQYNSSPDLQIQQFYAPKPQNMFSGPSSAMPRSEDRMFDTFQPQSFLDPRYESNSFAFSSQQRPSGLGELEGYQQVTYDVAQSGRNSFGTRSLQDTTRGEGSSTVVDPGRSMIYEPREGQDSTVDFSRWLHVD